MKLTDKELQFIKENINTPASTLSLNKKRPACVDFALCLKCIEGNQKMRKKVPLWAANLSLIYPYPLSLEQCSSQLTAEYKASLVSKIFSSTLPDKSFSSAASTATAATSTSAVPANTVDSFGGSAVLIADITGGMGVDSFFLSRVANGLLYMERDEQLCAAAENNFPALGAENITVRNVTSTVETVEKEIKLFASGFGRSKVNIIYADPARRSKTGSKVIMLEDYEPDILSLNAKLLDLADYLLVKVSPMADIKMYLQKLSGVTAVYVVSVDNECKELLFLMKAGSSTEPNDVPVTVICIDSRQSFGEAGGALEFTFTYRQENNAGSPVTYLNAEDTLPKYLYEPDKAILKAGAFKTIGTQYGLKKIAPSTHLYCGDTAVDFPGKRFTVIEEYDFGKKAFKEIAKKYPAASVTARNLPIDSNQLKKILCVKESNELHIFAFTDANSHKKIYITSV